MSFSVRYGGKKGKRISLQMSDELVAVRMQEGDNFDNLVRRRNFSKEISSMKKLAHFDRANIVVMQVSGKTRKANYN